MFLLHGRLSGVDGLADTAQLEGELWGWGLRKRQEERQESYYYATQSPQVFDWKTVPESSRAKYRPG